jgi:hypothetical protein
MGIQWDNLTHKDFMKTCDSVRMEVIYNTLIEFVIPVKVVRLIKMF